jgi:hypothetical protein
MAHPRSPKGYGVTRGAGRKEKAFPLRLEPVHIWLDFHLVLLTF